MALPLTLPNSLAGSLQNYNLNTTTPNTGGSGWSSFSDTLGNFGSAMQGIGGVANAWMGFNNLSLARDQFRFQRDFSNKNFDQQVKSLNNQLYNQYLAKQSYDPNTYTQSPAEYMAQWGLSDSSGNNRWTNSQPNTNVASAAPQTNNQDPNAQNNPMSAFKGVA